MIIVSYNIRGLGRRENRKDVKALLRKVKADVCCIQESKLEKVSSRIIKSIWGNTPHDWEFAKSEGSSGGIITIWNPSVFVKSSFWCSKDILLVNGFQVEDGKGCSIINIYALNLSSHRNSLWDQLSIFVSQRVNDCVCLVGDFNCIRNVRERCGSSSSWNSSDMRNFNNFIEGNNLMDLNLSGRTFTWYRPNGTCKSRLDRMIVNAECVNKWPAQVLKGGRRTLSDHCPIFVESPTKDWGPIPFRFYNHWMQHPTFKSFVTEKWRSFNVQGWGAYVLKEKLKMLKNEIKAWKTVTFGNWIKPSRIKKCEIERLDLLDEALGLDEDEARLREQTMNDLIKESSWKEAQLLQKSRIKWITEGDVNSQFFHKWISCRVKKNEISGIWIDGSWVDSVNGVKDGICNHFKNHFDSVNFKRPILPESLFEKKLQLADNSFLTMPFSEEKIKHAIWNVDLNGSPGPDGFSFGFFRNNWETVKGEIIQMMEDFHSHGKLVRGFNPSFICLVPKKDSPESIDDYRPISLISGAYKIISKILSDRLSKVIDMVVADNQSAFIKERQILDGILILNEAVDEAK